MKFTLFLIVSHCWGDILIAVKLKLKLTIYNHFEVIYLQYGRNRNLLSRLLNDRAGLNATSMNK